MDEKELISQAERIIQASQTDLYLGLTEAMEFFRIYAGEKSSFYKQLLNLEKKSTTYDHKLRILQQILGAYISFLQNGLAQGISLERRIQLDVVSDFLDQAQKLLNQTDVHPAAPTVLIGASLEEFLRNWLEEENVSLGNNKPSIDSYAKALKAANQITTQDMKDITSWAGLRNHAAHGEWEQIKEKGRITMMLEGVNLFMRRYM